MSQKAVITGATKGIGRAVAEKFCRQGYDLAVCSRNVQDLVDLKKELEERYPQREVWIHPCDITKQEDIIIWCNKLSQHWDRFEILFNNAGTFLPGTILTEPEESLMIQMQTNVFSAYYFTRLLYPMLKKNVNGHIFNLCSIASKKAYANGGAYAMSKFAIYGFSQCLREELKPTSIKVTSVLPGATWSDSWTTSSFGPEDMIQANDIAELLWTCSQLSKQAVVEEILIRPQGGDL